MPPYTKLVSHKSASSCVRVHFSVHVKCETELLQDKNAEVNSGFTYQCVMKTVTPGRLITEIQDSELCELMSSHHLHLFTIVQRNRILKVCARKLIFSIVWVAHPSLVTGIFWA